MEFNLVSGIKLNPPSPTPFALTGEAPWGACLGAADWAQRQPSCSNKCHFASPEKASGALALHDELPLPSLSALLTAQHVCGVGLS